MNENKWVDRLAFGFNFIHNYFVGPLILSTMWNWFVAPLGLPTILYWHAFGLIMLFMFFKIDTSSVHILNIHKKILGTENKKQESIAYVAVPLVEFVVWGFAYLAHLYGM